MAINKYFKHLLFTLAFIINVFGFSIEKTSAYPVFAQQNYSNPRAANGKLACANCHLNQKAIEVEAPQAILPNSVFEVEIKVPYDIRKQQVGANGKQTDLNVGGILILPKGFKLASKNQISSEIKEKNKGVFISPYSTEFDNILVVGPISGKTHQQLIFPVVSPDPEKNSDIKYLSYPIYAGGNRGRGQVYPTGEKSNNQQWNAPIAGTVSSITEIPANEDEGTYGGYEVTIEPEDGAPVTETILAGADLLVSEGEEVKAGQALTSNPNVGGFGQVDGEIVLQDPQRIQWLLAFFAAITVSQIMLVLKKKQVEKVQAAEGNF